MSSDRARILVVEDELMIALDTAAMLGALGYEAVGPVGQVADALALVQKEPLDGAVLDINLGRGERSFVVAEALAARGVPALFLTGYAIKDAAIPSHLAHIPVLGKPVHDRVLADALARLDG